MVKAELSEVWQKTRLNFFLYCQTSKNSHLRNVKQRTQNKKKGGEEQTKSAPACLEKKSVSFSECSLVLAPR